MSGGNNAGSILLGGGVGAILTLLLTQGFKILSKEADKVGNTTVVTQSPSGEIQKFKISNDALISPQMDIFKPATTTRTTRDDNNPDYVLKNDSGVIKRILAITFIPDVIMQSEGLMEIHINSTRFFPITDPSQGFFLDMVDSFSVPIPDNYGIKLLPKEKLELFMWNPNANPVTGTIVVFLAEMPS